MEFLNIAGYKFITLTDLPTLRENLFALCEQHNLKGTILLSSEGINLSLVGTFENTQSFKIALARDTRFADMSFRESVSDFVPFRRMKIKLKKEIITMRRDEVRPEDGRAADISPQEFKRWLDENRDITILDTRNHYEVQFGTFKNAVDLYIKDFSEFPDCAEKIARDKPVVMFCTGGVRCEKAAIHLKNQGFKDVYQLEGGILNYFKEVGGAYYEGDCFVFDGRVALNSELKKSGAEQCQICQAPVQICHVNHSI